MKKDMASSILTLIRAHPVEALNWKFSRPQRILNNSLEFKFKHGFIWIIHFEELNVFDIIIRNKERRNVYFIKSVITCNLILEIDKAVEKTEEFTIRAREHFHVN